MAKLRKDFRLGILTLTTCKFLLACQLTSSSFFFNENELMPQSRHFNDAHLITTLTRCNGVALRRTSRHFQNVFRFIREIMVRRHLLPFKQTTLRALSIRLYVRTTNRSVLRKRHEIAPSMVARHRALNIGKHRPSRAVVVRNHQFAFYNVKLRRNTVFTLVTLVALRTAVTSRAVRAGRALNVAKHRPVFTVIVRNGQNTALKLELRRNAVRTVRAVFAVRARFALEPVQEILFRLACVAGLLKPNFVSRLTILTVFTVFATLAFQSVKRGFNRVLNRRRCARHDIARSKRKRARYDHNHG